MLIPPWNHAKSERLILTIIDFFKSEFDQPQMSVPNLSQCQIFKALIVSAAYQAKLFPALRDVLEVLDGMVEFIKQDLFLPKTKPNIKQAILSAAAAFKQELKQNMQ